MSLICLLYIKERFTEVSFTSQTRTGFNSIFHKPLSGTEKYIMTTFTDYQRSMWKRLSYLSVCRFYIDRDKRGNYMIKKSGKIRTLLYYSMWINSLIKILYLILSYQGFLLEVHFLDQMSMWDWFLCFSQLVQETNIWYRKYPLFETLHANWTIQEKLFRKLGSPTHIQQNILKTCKSLVYMHSAIVLVGCGALLIQFFTTPKYALNTYAIIPCLPEWDWPLKILFAAHEVFFIFQVWVHQASSIVLCEVFAVTYTQIIQGMTHVMRELTKHGKLKQSTSIKKKNGSPSESLSESLDNNNAAQKQFIPDRYLDPKEILPGTEYNILDLVHEYKRVMLASNEFNAWAGKLMGGTTISNYGQFIIDVFMMIQLLKEPETDIMGVFFFFEDACAGMAMLFRMLIILSRLYPASEEFMQAFKGYLQHETPIRKYLRKYQKSLKIVASKIGGYSTNPTTVPKGINTLMSYYIGAALWQRPVDRKT